LLDWPLFNCRAALDLGPCEAYFPAMTVTRDILAHGTGWRVSDVICTSGPRDGAFEEQHATVSIAAVTHGSFQYRTREGASVLVPGSILLGNPRACFVCGHEHAQGDRCIAFHLTPDYLAGAGVPYETFRASSLPPLAATLPLLADAEVAREERDTGAFEEIALRLADAATSLSGGRRRSTRANPRDERRITQAVRRIEANASDPLSLAALAREAAMSLFHFLRTFRQIVGMTPHQFILRTRLARAALRLRQSADPVAAIAFEAGFNDLSTFNRRFRRVLGVNPLAFRAKR
jgi:AraC-like DNA-binding protein